MCIAAAAIVYQGAVLAADNAYSKAQTAESATTERVEEALRAARLNPLNADYRQGVGLAYLAEMRAYLRAGADAQQKGEDATPYEKQVVRSFAEREVRPGGSHRVHPCRVRQLRRSGHPLQPRRQTIDKGLYQSAIDVAERGLEIMPLGTSIRVQLAQSLVATGRVSEAVETLEYCLEIDPMGGEAALYLASLYHQLGHTDKALEVLRSVEALAPGQPGIADAIKQLEAEASAP